MFCLLKYKTKTWTNDETAWSHRWPIDDHSRHININTLLFATCLNHPLRGIITGLVENGRTRSITHIGMCIKYMCVNGVASFMRYVLRSDKSTGRKAKAHLKQSGVFICSYISFCYSSQTWGLVTADVLESVYRSFVKRRDGSLGSMSIQYPHTLLDTLRETTQRISI